MRRLVLYGVRGLKPKFKMTKENSAIT